MPPTTDEKKLVRVIATRDFRNCAPKSIDLGEEALHPLHVHKGAEFTLDPDDKDDANLLVILANQGTILEICDKNKDKLDMLADEIKQDEETRQRDLAAAKKAEAQNTNLFQQFLAWLQANKPAAK